MKNNPVQKLYSILPGDKRALSTFLKTFVVKRIINKIIFLKVTILIINLRMITFVHNIILITCDVKNITSKIFGYEKQILVLCKDKCKQMISAQMFNQEY